MTESKDKNFKYLMVALIIMMSVAIIFSVFNMNFKEKERVSFEDMGITITVEDDLLSVYFKNPGNYSIDIESEYMGNKKGYQKELIQYSNSTRSWDISMVYDDVLITIKNLDTGYYETHRMEDL